MKQLRGFNFHLPRSLSIRWRLLLAIALPLLLITAVVMGFTLSRMYNYAASDIQQQHQRELDLYAGRIGAKYEAVAQVARSTAAFVALHENVDEEELYDLLSANVQQNELIYGSAVAFEPHAFEEGTRLFAPYVYQNDQGLQSLDIAAESYDYSNGDWEWYSAPWEKGALWTDAYLDDGAGGVPMTTYSAPIVRNGRRIGVATVDVHLNRLQQEAEQELAGQNFSILGPSGKYLAHYNPAAVMSTSIQRQAALMGNSEYQNIVRRILQGETGMGVVEDFMVNEEFVDDDVWVFYTQIPETGWSLTSMIEESVSTLELRRFLAQGIAGLLLVTLMAFALVWFVSSRMTRPIKALAEAVSRVAAGRLDTQLAGIHSSDELGRLSEGFSVMLQNLQKHIERESQETAIRRMVENELQVARQTQESLLPTRFPPFPERREFDLHAVNRAANHVAGDFFDFFLVNPRQLMFLVADVSGKGMSAALVMAVTRTIIRNLGQSGRSPGEILTETNNLLIDSQKRSAFVTVFLGCYNTSTGRIAYANAGHPPPYLLGRDGRIRECGQPTGTIVGMLENEQYQNAEMKLQPDETLLLFTDGYPDARSPDAEFYGQERIKAFLDSNAGNDPRALCEKAVKEVCRFQNNQLADDITLLALRRNPTRFSLLIDDFMRPRSG